MTITINAALYAADADDDSDPNAVTLTATGADADAAWGELRARIASVLGVDSLGDLEDVDADHTDPTAPQDLKRGTIDRHYIEWTENVAPPKKAAKATQRATPATTALSASDVAEAIGITAKELRVFLRADGTYKPVTAPGGRGRYQFVKTDVAKIKKAHAAWEKARAASKVERDKAKAAALADAAEKVAEAITAQEAEA